MKKFTLLFAAMMVIVIPVLAQSVDETNTEKTTESVAAQPAEDEAFTDYDEIKLTYVPNSFADNWEISLAGGVNVLFNGLGARDATSDPHYDALGGIAEIAATKWFNPYVGARLAWTTGYLPYKALKEDPSSIEWRNCPWHNYVHIDMMWDWTTQFGGYKPDRIYDAVPYVHAGIIGNPRNTIMVGGGVGLLNRFHLNNNWLLHLDVRATATSASKFSVVRGVAIDVNALFGVTYRFNQAGWENAVENPYKDVLNDLRNENKELAKKNAQAEKENAELRQRKQGNKDIVKLVESIQRDTVFYGIPDTMQLTVYYAINSSELSVYEKAHMNTYLRLIEQNDPNKIHLYKVIGSADAGTGAKEVNERVSRRRADAIKDVLVKGGIDPNNITIETNIVEGGSARMSRASHVIVYPVEKPKVVIPDTINLDDEE